MASISDHYIPPNYISDANKDHVLQEIFISTAKKLSKTENKQLKADLKECDIITVKHAKLLVDRLINKITLDEQLQINQDIIKFEKIDIWTNDTHLRKAKDIIDRYYLKLVKE